MGVNATLLVQIVTFALFVWFTMKLVWPHVYKAMREREARIAEGLAAAEKGSNALVEATAKIDAELKATRVQGQEILAAANKQATQIVEEARTIARAEADRIRAAAQAEVESEVGKAREALRKQVGELAVLGAARIVKREIDASKHAEVLSDLAARL